MPDQVIAKGGESKFRPHSDGQHIAQCADTIDLGEAVVAFAMTPKKLVHKCALVFRTGEQNPETGELIDIAAEFTVSMNEKANLRKFLEAWRGKAYTTEEAEGGVPLHKLVGNWALLTIEQKVSKNERRYARIISAVGVPKPMRKDLPTFAPYERAEYWQEKKQLYRAAALSFRAESGVDDDGEPLPDDTGFDDEDLPF